MSLISHIYLHSFHGINSQQTPTQPTSHESLTFTFTVCISDQVVLRYLGTRYLIQITRSLVAWEQAPSCVNWFSAN